MQRVLEEVELIEIAISIVLLEETFRAVNSSASVAPGVGYHDLLSLSFWHFQIPIAFLVRTDSLVWVFKGLCILFDFLVLLPGIEGQLGVESAAFIEEFEALFVRALHTLKGTDFVDDILVEAGGTESMVALGHGGHFFGRHLALADGAFHPIELF